MRHLVRLAALALLLGTLTGCGGPHHHKLSGHVTFKGQPVPAGEITLMPDADAGNKGPGVLATIKDGRYELPLDKGHKGGPYVARLTGFDGVTPPASDEPLDPRGQPLFVDRVEKFELPAANTTHDFVIDN